jgi:flagellar hook-associated protein 1
MGMPLNGILQIGVSGLRTHQTAISVTSHNIANVNTEGYSRQRANLTTELPLSLTPGQIGLGVRVTSVERLRDTLFDKNVRLEIGQQSRYEQSGEVASLLENVLGDPTTGNIGEGLTNFFNSYHNLTTGPEDLSTRQVVIEDGVALADFLRDAVGQFDRTKAGVDLSVTNSASNINLYLEQIAAVNKQINRAEISDNLANDFRDQRDLLLDKLSAYMDIDVSEQPNGMVDVVANGETLVSGFNFNAVQVATVGTRLQV